MSTGFAPPNIEAVDEAGPFSSEGVVVDLGRSFRTGLCLGGAGPGPLSLGGGKSSLFGPYLVSLSLSRLSSNLLKLLDSSLH